MKRSTIAYSALASVCLALSLTLATSLVRAQETRPDGGVGLSPEDGLEHAGDVLDLVLAVRVDSDQGVIPVIAGEDIRRLECAPDPQVARQVQGYGPRALGLGGGAVQRSVVDNDHVIREFPTEGGDDPPDRFLLPVRRNGDEDSGGCSHPVIGLPVMSNGRT